MDRFQRRPRIPRIYILVGLHGWIQAVRLDRIERPRDLRLPPRIPAVLGVAAPQGLLYSAWASSGSIVSSKPVLDNFEMGSLIGVLATAWSYAGIGEKSSSISQNSGFIRLRPLVRSLEALLGCPKRPSKERKRWSRIPYSQSIHIRHQTGLQAANSRLQLTSD